MRVLVRWLRADPVVVRLTEMWVLKGSPLKWSGSPVGPGGFSSSRSRSPPRCCFHDPSNLLSFFSRLQPENALICSLPRFLLF